MSACVQKQELTFSAINRYEQCVRVCEGVYKVSTLATAPCQSLFLAGAQQGRAEGTSRLNLQRMTEQPSVYARDRFDTETRGRRMGGEDAATGREKARPGPGGHVSTPVPAHARARRGATADRYAFQELSPRSVHTPASR